MDVIAWMLRSLRVWRAGMEFILDFSLYFPVPATCAIHQHLTLGQVTLLNITFFYLTLVLFGTITTQTRNIYNAFRQPELLQSIRVIASTDRFSL